MAARFLNVSFYKFVPVQNLQTLKSELMERGQNLNLCGTIILATEGINSCIAGDETAIKTLVEELQTQFGFGELDIKESWSEQRPFQKFFVKLKKEVIPLGMPDLDPSLHSGKYVEPKELKEWLDKQENVILVDTRNDYEVALGTFKNALDPNIATFREFPKWVEENLANKKDAKIVTFCTGGIRCEKATAYMRGEGFENVYQLHGGILRYLEQVGGSSETHYDGECFVFDSRVAVNEKLEKTNRTLCFACWHPLEEKDLTHPHYVKGESCGYCFEKKSLAQKVRNERGALKAKQKLQERKVRSKQAKEERGLGDEVTHGA